MDLISKLKPVFKENEIVTAGNSRGRNDGAGVVLWMSKRAVQHYGKKPRARIIAKAVAGVSSEYMGIGPVPATRKALKLAGLKLDDIRFVEINEAFAAQFLAVIRN